jgi:uncharacterized protein (DUF1697 family)
MARATAKSKVITLVALLRGINVGGKNQLPMKDLTAMFTKGGCSDVSTYIQSGNVVFRADADLATRIAPLIQQQIAKRFGLQVPVVLRTRDELAVIARSNPWLTPDADLERLMVMFLANRPSSQSIATLDPGRSPPDEFLVRGQEIYLRCPNGFARTRLTNGYFDSKLATISTGRNWRTVLKLLELTGGFAKQAQVPEPTLVDP